MDDPYDAKFWQEIVQVFNKLKKYRPIYCNTMLNIIFEEN